MGIPIASFFTGGGFLDMGFEQAGFDVAFSNEFNDDISDMHDHARPSKITFRGSIENVRFSEVPSVQGVIGGPPCPAFSVAGKQGGEDDPRGKLSRCYIHAILGLRPEFFVMENVPNLARSKKHSAYLRDLRFQLKDAGYATDVRILNALEFGAPQDRERMFMVGVSRHVAGDLRSPFGQIEEGWFPWPEPRYPEAKSRYPWPDMCPYGSTPPRPDVPEELTVHPLLRDLDIHHDDPEYGRVPNSTEWFQPYSKKFLEVWEGDVRRKSCKRLHRYRYSPTACYGNNEVHFHPWLGRRLSVRECLRIQTVPDSYVLPDKPLSIKYKLIGNGVPILLGHAVAKSVMAFLKQPCPMAGTTA